MRYLFQVGRHVGRMGGGSGSRPWLRPLGAVSVCCLVAGGAVRADPPEPPPAPRTPPTDVSALPGGLPGGIPSVCEEVGTAAERENGIPPGLLLAIGRVESGRWDAGRGRVTPWPWTINAAGKGQWFETREDAIRTVNALREAGTRSIDVGCFQVNLFYHPKAFADLDQAFTHPL